MPWPPGKKKYKRRKQVGHSTPNGGTIFIIENEPVIMKRSRPWTRKICFATGQVIKPFQVAYKRTIQVFHHNKFIKQIDWVSEEGYTLMIIEGREKEELWTVDLNVDRLL